MQNQTILDQLPFGVAYLDKEYRLVEINHFFTELTGLPPDLLLGKKCYEVAGEYKDDTSRQGRGKICSFCRIEEARRTGEKQVLERFFAGRWLRITTVPEKDACGEVARFLEIAEDITRHKQQEKRTAALLELSISVEGDEKTLLQRGLDTVQHLTDSSIAFLHFISEDQKEVELVTWSTDTLAHYCQAAFDRHYPLAAAGIWTDAVFLKQPVIINDYAAAPGKKGLPTGHAPVQRFICVPVLEGTQVRMIVGVGNAAKDYDEHDVETLRLFSHDLYRIVQRHRAEQAQAMLVTIIDATPDFIGFADAKDTHIIFINKAGREMTGLSEDEDVSKLKIADVHPEWTNKMLKDEILPATIRDGKWIGDCAFLNRNNGREIPVTMALLSHKAPNGEIEIFSTISRDITLKKQAEAELLEHDQKLHFQNRIAEIFLTHSHDLIYAEVLKVVLEATGSRYGIFGYLNDEGALVVPSMTQEIWDKCQIFGKAHVFPKKTWSNSSWPRAIREKKTIHANEAVCQTPTGHIAISRHISLPIIFQGKVIGLFQVANKQTDYTEVDIQRLEALANYIAPLLHARLERKRAEDMVANVLESIDEGFITIDRDFKIIASNRAYAEAVGSPLGEIIGQHCYKISHHIDRPCYLNGEDCAVKYVFDTGESRTTLHTHYNAAGQPIYVETRAFALSRNDLGEVQAAIEIVVDITKKKAREDEIHQLAFYDPLTHLPNRRLLLDRLEQAFIASSRNDQYGAVFFLDLDHFKTLNDTRGHEAGDLLLAIVAERLQASVREGDTVSRQGGDEFVVLIKNLSTEKLAAITQAGHVAEKIRADLDRPANLAGHEQHVTASIGISLFRSHDNPVEDLFKHADTAMYQAKSAGRNCVRFFDPAMQAALEAASSLETDLRQAMQQGQFQLHYQPQVENGGRIIGAEALLRWTHPGRGKVPTAAFIPLAEETGLILPIGRWVLEEACGRLAAWAGIPAASGLRLAVNVSARQFRQADFVEEVRQVIAATGADPARLKLELTESLVLVDVPDTIAKMLELKALGIGFSMDDFGTGYSSLSQLKRLPLEQLKIDQSFIRDLGRGTHDAVIVETIIAMGRTMGLHVIAEGVETEAQLGFLIQSGCDAYQGYLFSRPVPAAEFECLLAAGIIKRK